MSQRRAFLKQASALTVLGAVRAGLLGSNLLADPPGEVASLEYKGWKPTWIKQGDGKGGWVLRPAQIQFLDCGDGKKPYYDSKFQQLMPFGVVSMENGEVALIGAKTDESKKWPRSEVPVIAFSRDRGNTWTPFQSIDESDDCFGRPMLLTYLGKGNLMFQAEGAPAPTMQYFSHDYGHTWPDRQPLQPASNGEPFNIEGSPLVDRDANGAARRIAAIGFNYARGSTFPKDPEVGRLRWSEDGGKTWINETQPGWGWKEQYEGKTYLHGTGEGSIVRAKNGWLVAAVRTDMAARFFSYNDDNVMGFGVSVSKDEGKTWSPLQRLYDGGRHHTHLLVMPNGDIVVTYIMRIDIQNGRLVSYRRGAGAVVSYDHGLTWDMAQGYLLGDFEFTDGTPLALACGHQFSAQLDDGHILTAFGHYPSKGACLVKWRPTARKPGH